MSSNIQLISFVISFLYGVIFYFLTIINFKLIENIKKIYQHILTFIYVIDITIMYVIVLFHVNKGYFHIYFIIMVFVGYLVGFIIAKKVLSKINVNKIIRR